MTYVPHIDNVEKWNKFFSSDRADKRMKGFYIVTDIQHHPIANGVTVVSPVESESNEERRNTKAGVKRQLAQLTHNLSGVKTKKKK